VTDVAPTPAVLTILADAFAELEREDCAGFAAELETATIVASSEDSYTDMSGILAA
jgi:hypothetical protein